MGRITNRLAVLYHEDCARHETGPGHPERPARITHLYSRLRECGIRELLDWEEASPAPMAAMERLHAPAYLRYIEQACLEGQSLLDHGDTHACPDSFDIARLAAGAAIGGVDAVMAGGYRCAFAAVRPPGHHARPGEAMGFCLVNHIAIAAEHARQRYGLHRLLVVDFDVHHGNGTGEMFYRDPDVFFISSHQYPFWPGSGAAHEQGDGPGLGATRNIPLESGTDGPHALAAWRKCLAEVTRHFRPQLILASAGFDAHARDPLASLQWVEADYAQMARLLVDTAESLGDVPLVSVLEGGYDLEALSGSVIRYLEAMLD